MIKYYKTINKKILEIDSFEKNCWVSIVKPNTNEINEICNNFNINRNDFLSALDREEGSRLEIEDDYNMVLIDIPIDESDDSIHYTTVPLGIILAKDCIITICSMESSIIKDLSINNIKDLNTSKRTKFLFQIFKLNALYYLRYLRAIDKRTSEIEKNIYKSVENKELIQLLNLEKSLIYFSTSLKSNETTINKITRSKHIEKFKDDEDFLEEVIIENKQALEMAKIYGDILSRVMDAFSSIISNNQNRVISILTIVTLSMSVITIISGLFGMNVEGIPFNSNPNGFFIITIISIVVSIILSLLLLLFSKKNI